MYFQIKKKKFEKIFSSFFKHFQKKRYLADPLASHTTHVLVVNFIREWQDYSLTSTPNDRFLRNFFMAILFTHRIFARNLVRGNRQRSTFRILFWSISWGSSLNRFLRNFYMAGLFTLESFCQKSAERKSPKKYFSYFIFDDWPGIRTQAFAFNRPTHYILDHDDLTIRCGNFVVTIF